MQEKPRLITSYSEVVENVRRFNEGLARQVGLEKYLPYFKAWYYIPEEDAVGPSKFVGYHGMTPERYLEGGLDGKETEGCVPRFFRQPDKGSSEYQQVRRKVENLLQVFGKKPSSLARFSVPR